MKKFFKEIGSILQFFAFTGLFYVIVLGALLCGMAIGSLHGYHEVSSLQGRLSEKSLVANPMEEKVNIRELAKDPDVGRLWTVRDELGDFYPFVFSDELFLKLEELVGEDVVLSQNRYGFVIDVAIDESFNPDIAALPRVAE